MFYLLWFCFPTDTAIAMDNDLELAIKTADDLKRVDHESKDRLLATKLDLDSLENPPLGESSTTTHTYRLISKGLVSEELIKDDTMLVVGLGMSLCDSHDNTILEINKALRNQKLAHPEAAELAAIIHGLKWALELGVESIQFFCNDSNILGYVSFSLSFTPESNILYVCYSRLSCFYRLLVKLHRTSPL